MSFLSNRQIKFERPKDEAFAEKVLFGLIQFEVLYWFDWEIKKCKQIQHISKILKFKIRVYQNITHEFHSSQPNHTATGYAQRSFRRNGTPCFPILTDKGARIFSAGSSFPQQAKCFSATGQFILLSISRRAAMILLILFKAVWGYSLVPWLFKFFPVLNNVQPCQELWNRPIAFAYRKAMVRLSPARETLFI